MALEELLISFCKPGFPEMDKISFNIVRYLKFHKMSCKTSAFNWKLKMFILQSDTNSCLFVFDLFVSDVDPAEFFFRSFPDIFSEVPYFIGMIFHCYFAVSFLISSLLALLSMPKT